MKTVTPYLLFNGNCEEAFTYYQKVFGGELEITRFGDMPGAADAMDAADLPRIANVALQLNGEEQILMASDAMSAEAVNITDNDRYLVCLEPGSRDEAERLIGELNQGGETMPLQETAWAELFGMCRDQFQINWMINYTGDKVA
jgi:PhnB protein